MKQNFPEVKTVPLSIMVELSGQRVKKLLSRDPSCVPYAIYCEDFRDLRLGRSGVQTQNCFFVFFQLNKARV